jgi:UDP-3-O-[3-hydroxymyristoyl] glucosamine N-acyltransferase
MPNATLLEICHLVGGKLIGDPTVSVQQAMPVQDATLGCITLADSKEQLLRAIQSPAAAIVANLEFDGESAKPLILVPDIHAAFITIIQHLRPSVQQEPMPKGSPPQISDSASVSPCSAIGAETVVSHHASIGQACQIGDRCIIHPNVTIMDHCRIGNDCELFPGCVLYAGTIIGERTIVHANATLGAYGFGYRQSQGKHLRTAQLGWVEIGDDVEIGAGSSIDRGTYGATRVGSGTKIDNLVQIGHNCQLGKHNLICAQVGVAGSCSTGDYVVMGGQVGLADHLHIGDRAMIGAQSGLMRDLSEDEVVLGSPAIPIKQKMQEFVLVGRLPELKKELRALRERVSQVAAESGDRDTNSPSDTSTNGREALRINAA